MPDLLSHLLSARPSIRRCAAAADARFADGGAGPHLLVFDGEQSHPIAGDSIGVCENEPELLTLQLASELPWRRRIAGCAAAVIGLVATAIAALTLETVLDLLFAALGGVLASLGLWIAGLFPHAFVTATASPGRIVVHGLWGSRSFSPATDAAFLLPWPQSGGWEVVLVAPTGCVRTVWISDRQLPLVRSCWQR